MLEKDTKPFKRKIDELIIQNPSIQVIEKNTTDYSLARPPVYLKIKIDVDWFGYEVMIRKSNSKASLGISEDTDNYPLWGENEAATKEVYEHMITVLMGIAMENIYVKYKHGKAVALAVPINDSDYKVIEKINFFMTNTTFLRENDLVEKKYKKVYAVSLDE